MEKIEFRITKICHIIERRNAAGWHMSNICSKHYVIVFVLDGEAEYSIGGEPHLLQKNNMYIFSPNLLRSGKTDPQNPWSFISIMFDMELNEEARNFFDRSILAWHNMGTYQKLFSEASKAWTGKDPLFKVKCSMLLTEIVYQLFLSNLPHQNTPHTKKLEYARSVIQQNFKNEISVEELAKSLDMSVSYFRRLFHKVYGYSPMQYIMNLRIENARDLLLSGEVNVTEAAHLSGFDDIYYFSRLFKAKTGVSPSKLQKM